MTIKTAAEYLKVSPRTVYNWLQAHPEIERAPRSGITHAQLGLLAELYHRKISPDQESILSQLTEEITFLREQVAALIRALQRSDLAYTGPQVAVR